MKIIKKVLMILVLLSVSSSTMAQLSNAQEADISIRVQETVGNLTDCISAMAAPDVQNADRFKFKESAILLFAGQGKPYTYAGVYHNPASMEVTYLNTVGRVSKSTKPMTDYFANLIRLATSGRYTSCEITFTDVYDMKVSSLRQLPDGTYTCSVTYVQYTNNQRKDGSAYIDETEKTITCYIEVDDTINGKEFVVRLGDVKANETRRGQQ